MEVYSLLSSETSENSILSCTVLMLTSALSLITVNRPPNPNSQVIFFAAIIFGLKTILLDPIQARRTIQAAQTVGVEMLI